MGNRTWRATLAVLVLAACGGSGSDDSGTGAAPEPNECESDLDCSGGSTECTRAECIDGQCQSVAEESGASCSDGVCDGEGACVECLDDAACSDGTCSSGTCISAGPPSCEDGVTNGDETGEDCGGSCPVCENGGDCWGAEDCASGYCNQSADDVPGECEACVGSDECGGNAVCDDGVCTDELVTGRPCAWDGVCASGICQDGVCCESTCDRGCETCAADGAEGTCTPYAAGSDPDNACPAGRFCDGAGDCKAEVGVLCGTADECLSGFCVDEVCCQTTCEGDCEACNLTGATGTCSPLPIGEPGTPSCQPYFCDGTSGTCPATCGADDDCAVGTFCGAVGGTCETRLGLGDSCDRDRQCLTDSCCAGQCVDLDVDALHCGVCGTPCGAAGCVGGECGKLVFVTSTLYSGDLGALVGADAICQGHADAASLAGTYLAWLSVDTASPNTRFTHSSTPYVRVDGVKVADDYPDLTDGDLDAPINVTELGTQPPPGEAPSALHDGGPLVFTATSQWGALSTDATCNSWTGMPGGTEDGTVLGNYNSVWDSWTESGSTAFCADYRATIYCFEQ